jgi:hypothetical protein
MLMNEQMQIAESRKREIDNIKEKIIQQKRIVVDLENLENVISNKNVKSNKNVISNKNDNLTKEQHILESLERRLKIMEYEQWMGH